MFHSLHSKCSTVTQTLAKYFWQFF